MDDKHPPYEVVIGPGAEVFQKLGGETGANSFYNQFEPQDIGNLRRDLGPHTEETKRRNIDDLVVVLGNVVCTAAVVQRTGVGVTILNISTIDKGFELAGATAPKFQHHGYAQIGREAVVNYAKAHGIQNITTRIRGGSPGDNERVRAEMKRLGIRIRFS